MRNSVKVVIDAYDGTVDAYIADPNDAVVKTYAKIFDGIFKPLHRDAGRHPRHVRYPGDLFRIQTALHATFHMVAARDVLPPRRSVADPGRGQAGDERESVHAPHHHEASGRERSGVHLHDAVHPARKRQPRGLDGGADGRRQLRQAVGLSLPEAEPRLWSEADREPHQSGHRDLASAHALESGAARA